MSAQDTTAIVQSLKEKCRHALQILSSFLKVYLYQLGLDKPFTGGLGSFKLYVMIAHIVWKNFHYVQETRPNYGMLLLLFLQYFGQEKNLCKETCLTVGKAEVTFEGTLQVILTLSFVYFLL